jgi:ribonucleoside-diphosphate reductase alpha chain
MKAVVRLRDDTTKEVAIEHIDKPLETTPDQTMARIARGIAAVEAEDKQAEWQKKFEWLLEDWKFVPGGRIWAGAGTDQELTFYNCYVVPSPHDSRGGIVKTLQQMMEIMSRGGGVGINVSSLRPRYGYVKGVNGRSSGAVSWGGLYSFVTGLIEQGGCLTPDTLVFTEKGLLRLDELVTHGEKGWRDHNLTMMTDEGPRQSRSVYNNGVADVLKVETDMGMTITGTPNHKVKVMTDEGPAWRRLDRLQTGDAIMVKLGQHQGQYQPLQHPALKHHNQDAVELPTVLDEKLAYFLGYFMGDGFMTARDGDWRLGVSVAHDSYLMDEMPRLLVDLFPGVNVRLQQKENDASAIYVVSNRVLKEFLRLNGLEKALSNAVSVPALIRQSPASVVGAFLQGLFEADGGLSHGYPSLMSVSKRLIDEVSTLLIGLGCPVKIDMLPDGGERYGTLPRWRARVHSFRGLAAYCANVGADPRSRFASCLDHEPDMAREHSYILPNSRYWVDPVLDAITLPQTDHRAVGERFAATDQPLRRKLLRYTRGDRNLTLSAYATLSEKHEEFAAHAPSVNDTWFVFVDRVSTAGQSLTLDLEVDENHTYIANGLVTHNSRRGALMLICNDWHPDVMEFINSKREAGKITNANISVGISDAFMDAVKQDADWDLVFPDTLHPTYDTEWNGDLEAWQAKGYPVIRHKTIKAKEMWNQIIASAWASAEPGLWFRDRANKTSNSWYFNQLICTNPCGEQPLPSFGICNLGAVNLAKFVKDGAVDWEMLGQTVRYATRFLDDVIDATPYFFPENAEQQGKERRVGLGVMGLAEMMIRLGLRYGSDEGNAFLDELFKFFASEAYIASAENAAEKGSFPAFDAEKYLQSGFMQGMPEEVRETIREKGARNVTLLTVAPTGTTGTMVSTSTGVEPYYFWSYFRKSRLGVHEEVVDVVKAWRDENPSANGELPDYFVTAMDLSPEDHVKVQAVVQKWIDSSISKTCNVPNHYTVEQTAELYQLMYDLGCKGGTIYRDGSRDEQVLNIKKEEPKAATPVAEAPKAVEAPKLPQISPNYTNVGDHKRKRARRLKGATYFVHTPIGKAFVTVNRNGDEEPFEVFANVGKVGSEGAAMSEALGRLVSLVLRLPSHITPSERLEMVVEQLGGIGGARSIGFGANRVASLPDALAQVLREDLEAHRQDEAAILLGEADPEPQQLELLAVTAQADLCPECGHASFIRIEGCKKCVSCGHAEC